MPKSKVLLQASKKIKNQSDSLWKYFKILAQDVPYLRVTPCEVKFEACRSTFDIIPIWAHCGHTVPNITVTAHSRAS